MTVRAKRLAGGVIGIIAAYLIILPFFWPDPRVSAVVPAQSGMRDVLKFEVAIHAWHRNVDITRVRFYADYTTTTAKGPKGIFYPELVIDRPGKNYWGPLKRNLLSWPYTQRMPAEFDLSRFADKGLLGPGELIGKLDISFNYAPARPGKSFRRDPTRTATQSVPFRIVIHE
ncbi:MAG: hypothetical protein SGI88_15795 [Candidatus Hydrogenedentes bacterium]|nr:hypothetical protein [Candidatus Hydrogenedentota bacterium]